jgi:channel protein (hemolysin III family)
MPGFEPMRLLPIPGFNDPFSSLSHLAGAAIFAWLSVDLLRRGRGNRGRLISLAVFATACVLMLTVSGIYHSLQTGSAPREVLQRLDHATIFVLIAASFTPVHVILFRGPWQWGMLTGIWILAIAGLALNTLYFGEIPERVWLGVYLGLGWLGLLSWAALWRRHGFHFVRVALWGGLAYTLGALADFLRWPVLVPQVFGPHEAFHLAVLAGIAFHWSFIHRIAVGTSQDQRRPEAEPRR